VRCGRPHGAGKSSEGGGSRPERDMSKLSSQGEGGRGESPSLPVLQRKKGINVPVDREAQERGIEREGRGSSKKKLGLMRSEARTQRGQPAFGRGSATKKHGGERRSTRRQTRGQGEGEKKRREGASARTGKWTRREKEDEGARPTRSPAAKQDFENTNHVIRKLTPYRGGPSQEDRR